MTPTRPGAWLVETYQPGESGFRAFQMWFRSYDYEECVKQATIALRDGIGVRLRREGAR